MTRFVNDFYSLFFPVRCYILSFLYHVHQTTISCKYSFVHNNKIFPELRGLACLQMRRSFKYVDVLRKHHLHRLLVEMCDGRSRRMEDVSCCQIGD